MSISFRESKDKLLSKQSTGTRAAPINKVNFARSTPVMTIGNTPEATSETAVEEISETPESFTISNKYPYYQQYADDALSYIDLSRHISMDSSQINLTHETHSQFIPFSLPRYTDGIDLMDMQLQIHFVNSENRENFVTPVNVKYSDSTILFAWLIDDSVTYITGAITFEIIATGKNEKQEKYVWKTRANYELNVEQSLSADATVKPTVALYDSIMERIDELQTAIDTETKERKEQDTSLDGKITKEQTERTNADGELKTQLTTETNDRKAQDTSLEGKITAEQTARQTGDTKIEGELETETTNRTTEDSKLQSKIDEETKKLATETTNRTSGDKTLTDKITELTSKLETETSQLEQKESSLETQLETISSEVSEFSTELTEEQTAREKGDSDLQTKLTKETSERTTQESSLKSQISSEQSTRTSQDNSLDTKITNLTSKLTAEESARQTGDTNLETKITQAEDKKIKDEESAREAADTKLQAAIDALKSNINLGNYLIDGNGDF